MGRAPCCDKANVKKGPWSPEEDAKLKAYIDKYGTGGNWIALPQKIGLKRCGKSCRLRWLNYLRPNIKHGGFSEEEDNIICSLYISIGSRWSIIAAQLPGRTDNDIKNYWNTRLKKKLLGRRNKHSNMNRGLSSSTGGQDSKDESGVDDNSPTPPALSNSALERLQLHMQLQSLQNPFPFYNSPSLWPKLHPLQEKMIQNLRCSNENPNPNPLMQHVLPTTPQSLNDDHKVHQFYEPLQTGPIMQDYPKIDELDKYSLNGISSTDSSVAFATGLGNLFETNIQQKSDGFELLNGTGTQPVSFQATNNFLLRQEDHEITEFDCFKDVDDATKETMIWWNTNNFDSKSGSSNSWDSATCVLQSEMFQDYALGYNL